MNTPSWRAFLRSSVSWLTVRPTYSDATSECAVAATFASSATTSFFCARLSANAFSDWVSSALLRIPIPENDTDRDVLRVPAGVLRRLIRWPLQVNLSGCTIYAGLGFETFPAGPG